MVASDTDCDIYITSELPRLRTANINYCQGLLKHPDSRRDKRQGSSILTTRRLNPSSPNERVSESIVATSNERLIAWLFVGDRASMIYRSLRRSPAARASTARRRGRVSIVA
ncbi:hypothetical protein EVAR_69170_1 [Eumeta japonica]|uniref:Uncharacterized protein n=1 Tax=Eumeta variegata TaxID=151549 RepID=A0A4C1ZGG2_EUMVA|nr:hypothetical protein EVAR_69170_1 [Eumeta japonica]